MTATPDPVLRTCSRLAADDVARVLDLAEAAAVSDGTYPLSEHVALHLRHGDPDARHLLVEDPATGALLGYAHLDRSEPAEGARAELAVSPRARRHGVGAQLIDALVAATDGHGPLELWAHGEDASARRLAGAHGFHRIRHLWQLRRSLHAPLAPVVLPDGVSLRAFDAARDVEPWLELNARAFADLPDQGGWTEDDLRRRMAEPWFDPDGFLLAHDAACRLVGFHWTKVHGHTHPHQSGAHVDAGGHARGRDHDHQHVHDPLGEVYVLGVDPELRGHGLGRSLTLAGLHHLRSCGLSVVVLYVDAENAGAIALYRSLGFAEWDSDTLFSR